MRARIVVTLKEGVLDPAGEAVRHSLLQLGFSSVKGVRIGKTIDVELGDVSPEEAKHTVREMSERLLANPVVENFEIVDAR